MKKKVLIVDDESDMRTYFETLISENGYETKTAEDGDTGFEIARTFRPDVITLDIIMDRETGVKFYRNIVKHPELKTVPVIIVSGVGNYKKLFERDHATMPKAFAFLEKPVEPSELLEKIEEALKQRV
jgi:twitching motility two-component system response regulator PilH